MAGINWFVSLLLPPALGIAQVAQPPLRFEVASLKPAATPTWLPEAVTSAMQGSYEIRPPDIRMPHPGRVEIRNASHQTLIAMAYGVPKRTVRAPKWANETLFNVDARPIAGSSRDQVRGMLRSLLEDRFDLAAHYETEEKSGYSLVVSKGGAKLSLAAKAGLTERAELAGADDAERAALAAALVKRSRTVVAETRQIPPGVSRHGFAHVSAQQIAAIVSGFVSAPVIDMTGLNGSYDVTIDIGGPEQPEYSIFAGVEKLGLRLTRRRVSTTMLVVDRLEKAPKPN